jgi:FAD/FMN-containing dehydrogenase
VDVSTSAQATLGGMVGNNSWCHQAYGNICTTCWRHAWLADGSPHDPVTTPARQPASHKAIGDFSRPHLEHTEGNRCALAQGAARRVAGYNLDIFSATRTKSCTRLGQFAHCSAAKARWRSRDRSLQL